eukprot:gene15082-17828_t
MPPLLPLAVTWRCHAVDQNAGLLDVRSDAGLANVASDCRMLFNVTAGGAGGAEVEFEMSYVPVSPLAVLAVPVLAIDNALALKFLLPAALDRTPKLDKFRKLMGALYGGAGIAHAIDLLGQSKLLAYAGAPVFADCSPLGQSLAVAWCAAGPFAFLCSRKGGATADLGLAAYGLIEVFCAAVVASTAASGAMGTNALVNAVGVQAVIAFCWFSLSTQPEDA